MWEGQRAARRAGAVRLDLSPHLLYSVLYALSTAETGRHGLLQSFIDCGLRLVCQAALLDCIDVACGIITDPPIDSTNTKEIHKPKKQPAAVLGSLGSRSSFLRRPADRACLSGSRALSSTRRHCGCSALVRGHRQRRRHRASSRATWRHDPRHRASARAAARQGPHLRAIRHRRARRGHALELCRALAAMRPPRHHVCRTRRLVSLVRGRLRPPG